MLTEQPMIESLRVRRFRTLADLELSGLPPAAVLIGPNGSGKSNVLRFFALLRHMLEPRMFESFVKMQGGAGSQLFSGAETTDRITAEVALKIGGERYDYRFALECADPDGFYFSEEAFRKQKDGRFFVRGWQDLGKGHRDANLVVAAYSRQFPYHDRDAASKIVRVLRKCAVYQFHNTGVRSPFRGNREVSPATTLNSDGGNLAAVLYRIERDDLPRYQRICRYVGRLLPGFAGFDISEEQGKVALRWRSDWSASRFGAHLTSDGSLRLFALVTLLNMPPAMLPDVVLLDEPELGLHPAGVSLIGGMIRSLSTQKQIIVATQDPRLVDAFGLDQTFVFELREGRTEVRQCDPDQYRHWLDEYSTGELWEKNLLGGRP